MPQPRKPEEPLATLLRAVRACTHCAAQLPEPPRPVLQVSSTARILIAGQAPGRKVHATGIPFNDASGERLRTWLGMSREVFYDADRVAIVPMGFCYPGSGRSGDLQPRRECAALWRARLLSHLHARELTLAIGQYAITWHLPQARGSLTDIVRDWRRHFPAPLPLPHPSPRNNGWLRRNPWFEAELVQALQARVREVLMGS